MPAVLSTQSGSQPTREDDGERAAGYRTSGGSFRMPLDRLGFFPGNRGGMGCSGSHVHEVAWDGTANKVKLRRYKEIEIAAIPEGKHAAITGHWKSLQR